MTEERALLRRQLTVVCCHLHHLRSTFSLIEIDSLWLLRLESFVARLGPTTGTDDCRFGHFDDCRRQSALATLQKKREISGPELS